MLNRDSMLIKLTHYIIYHSALSSINVKVLLVIEGKSKSTSKHNLYI